MHRIIGRVGTLVLFTAVTACNNSPRQGSATLQGSISTAGGSAAPGILATIAGSKLSTRSDTAGQFSLQGADDGPATLRLSGPGLNASITVPRLHENLIVRVSVRLSDDGSAELENEPEAELSGSIDSVKAPDLVVSGQTVHTDAHTGFRIAGVAAALADLKAGEQVEVEGAEQADGSVLAREIKIEGAGDAASEIELRGVISALSSPDLSVAGRTVHTNAGTRIEVDGQAAAFGALKAGQAVKVKGAAQGDGSVLAGEIKASSALPPPPPTPASEVELRGTVDSLSGGDLTVSGHLVHTNTLTVVDGHGANALADIRAGALVEVHGALQADGSTLATRIHVED